MITCFEMAEPKKRPKKLSLPQLKMPTVESDENRWMVLDTVSRMIVLMKQREYVFALCKAWSVTEPNLSSESFDTLCEKAEIMSKAVVGNRHGQMQFHLPLLTKLAFASEDKVHDLFLWWKFKQRIRSLGPQRWRECQEKVARAARDDPREIVDILYPFPRFLDSVSGRLEQACLKDTEIINRLHDICMRGGPHASEKYRNVCVERRKNVMEMNKYLSIMALFVFLCETRREDRWTGLDLVSDFFSKNNCDWCALLRYSRVLVVDSITSRVVTWDSDNEPDTMEYVMDDSGMEESYSDAVKAEDENEWWQYLTNALCHLGQKQVSCSSKDLDDLSRLVLQVAGKTNNTRSVAEVLHTRFLSGQLKP